MSASESAGERPAELDPDPPVAEPPPHDAAERKVAVGQVKQARERRAGERARALQRHPVGRDLLGDGLPGLSLAVEREPRLTAESGFPVFQNRSGGIYFIQARLSHEHSSLAPLESKLKSAGPLELCHSWPLYERARHFELGCLLSSAAIDVAGPAEVGQLALLHAGCWDCDLANDSLTWSGGVYDIFGLPRGAKVSRDEAVALYCEESRAAMERLRSYAIKHKRGFTLDVEIRPAAGGGQRWVRLIGVPVSEGDRAMRLHGLKLII